MNKIIKIGNKSIGDGYPCFVISEAGSNHDGSFSKALKLIDVAVAAKADAVKFQTFKAHKMYTEKAGLLDYIKTKKTIYQVVKEMEMPKEWVPKLANYCQKRGIIFISTPCDEESVDILDPYVPAFKIASYEMTHIPLLKYVAKKNKPIILSTGAANMNEVKKIVLELKKNGVKNLILMQCTASYPTELEDVNVKVIQTLKKTFKIPVGFSDHSREPDVAPMAAVAVGADIVEKHFTLSNKLPGPDHKFAVEPQELKYMIEKIRMTEKAMGSDKKVTLPTENYLRKFARRNIYAIKNINKGENFSKNNIAVLRRGNNKFGLYPDFFDILLRQTSKRNIGKNDPIIKKDL